MSNEYLVYTAVANLQTELRTQLKQIVALLEDIRRQMAAITPQTPAPPAPAYRSESTPIVIEENRQSL